MPKTHRFTDNVSEQPVVVVIDKIQFFQRDDHSECTQIRLTDGSDLAVSETVEEVQRVIETNY